MRSTIRGWRALAVTLALGTGAVLTAQTVTCSLPESVQLILPTQVVETWLPAYDCCGGGGWYDDFYYEETYVEEYYSESSFWYEGWW